MDKITVKVSDDGTNIRFVRHTGIDGQYSVDLIIPPKVGEQIKTALFVLENRARG